MQCNATWIVRHVDSTLKQLYWVMVGLMATSISAILKLFFICIIDHSQMRWGLWVCAFLVATFSPVGNKLQYHRIHIMQCKHGHRIPPVQHQNLSASLSHNLTWKYDLLNLTCDAMAVRWDFFSKTIITAWLVYFWDTLLIRACSVWPWVIVDSLMNIHVTKMLKST